MALVNRKIGARTLEIGIESGKLIINRTSK